MIKIKKTPTADTRTCDWSKVTKEELLKSSREHIYDVQQALSFFESTIDTTSAKHDFTKIRDIEQFHSDFQTGFKQTGWYDNHRKEERHHINADDGVRDDVNLIDVLEYIADCVMAGMARSGSVYDLQIKDDVLRKAFKNTVELLKSEIQIEQ